MAGIHRPMSQMRKLETKEAIFRARKRILKYLVLAFLKQEGFFNTAETFSSEASLTDDYEVCDNIDLDIILQDYCSYYLTRFNKQPQFCRRVEAPLAAVARRPPTTRQRRAAPPTEQTMPPEMALPGACTITRLHPVASHQAESTEMSIPTVESKPLSGLLVGCNSEKKQLIELLYQDIVRASDVRWSDVKGLEEAKSLLMESVVYPVRYPQLFTELLEPWRGLLLHGPPGAGKTMLAKAVACESSCTFFNVSCGTIVNKWRGESEKIVKVLFEMASYYAPSIIFMDEVDSVASERASVCEHEASRRLKAQLLTELDGMAGHRKAVFLLANSNMPWEIDPAMLRRFEKRIYIPLPDSKTRVELFESFLNSKTIEMYPKVNFEELATRTEGYSGSDIKLVCKEALMSTVRKMLPHLNTKGGACKNKDRLDLSDVMTAIAKTKPVSKNLAEKHKKWQSEMGCS